MTLLFAENVNIAWLQHLCCFPESEPTCIKAIKRYQHGNMQVNWIKEQGSHKKDSSTNWLISRGYIIKTEPNWLHGSLGDQLNLWYLL